MGRYDSERRRSKERSPKRSRDLSPNSRRRKSRSPKRRRSRSHSPYSRRERDRDFYSSRKRSRSRDRNRSPNVEDIVVTDLKNYDKEEEQKRLDIITQKRRERVEKWRLEQAKKKTTRQSS